MSITTTPRVLSAAPQTRRPFSVSIVRNTQPGGKLCKTLRYNQSTGEVVGEPAAFLAEGRARVATFDGVGAFMAFRATLTTDTALMMGVPCYDDARIVTQDALAGIPADRRRRERIIARDRAHVSWPEGPAFSMLDFDGPDRFPADIRARTPTTPEGWRQLLIELLPSLDGVQMGWAASSSSCLYVGDREVHGVLGQRFYVGMASGQDIPQFKDALHDALAKHELVWYEVSKSGALLLRTPFDFAVYQPERLDFAAGPECTPPLEWRPVEYKLWNDTTGTLLATADLPVSTEADRRRIQAALVDLRRAKLDEARAVRRKWMEETGRRIADSMKVSPAQAEEVAEAAVERGVLLSDFVLTDSDGQAVPVGELLANSAKHNGRRFRDPLEPDYRNDPRIAVFLVGDDGEPRIYSHAHGGRSWRCRRAIPVIRTGLTDKTVDQIARELERDDCGMFRNGDSLVWISEGDAKMRTLTPEGLGLRLQRAFQFLKLTKSDGWVRANVPPRDVMALQSEAPILPVRPLDAVVRGPFARADGSIVDTPGYDPASRVLYVAASPHPPKVRRNLTLDEAKEAFWTLWYPFQGFPLKTNLDHGVLLSAILTAVVRASIPIAPGYCYTAPAAGTGKSLLASTVGALQTGAPVAVSPLPEREEERHKHIFACLRQGAESLIYDNAKRGSVLDSPVLANLITSPLIEERVLGVSNIECRPNRLMIALTGNNLTLRGDLCRRILPVTLDAGVEHPWQRKFGFHPVNYVLAHWYELRIAALELIEGWRTHGAPPAPGVTSFTEWDNVVRSVVHWVDKELKVGLEFGDPAEAMQASYAEDPESEILGNLLEAWFAVFQDREVQLKDIEDAVNPTLNDNLPLDQVTPPLQGRSSHWPKRATPRLAA